MQFRRNTAKPRSPRRFARRLAVWFAALALALPLGLSGLFPVLARLAAGPDAHVCHCASHGGHTACACPICNPDQDDDPLASALTNPCGTENPVHHASLPPAVLPPALAEIAPLASRLDAPRPRQALVPRFLAPPEPPPPKPLRSLLSRV